jgi:hypothetical protein
MVPNADLIKHTKTYGIYSTFVPICTVTKAGASLNAASDDEMFWSFLRLEKFQLSPKLTAIKNMKFADTARKTILGVIVLKTVSFTSVHNRLRF